MSIRVKMPFECDSSARGNSVRRRADKGPEPFLTAASSRRFRTAFRRRSCRRRGWLGLGRISHHLTVEARDRPAITALRLLVVLNVLFKYARIIQEMRRRASRALY